MTQDTDEDLQQSHLRVRAKTWWRKRGRNLMACFTLRDLEACVLEMSRWYVPGTPSVGTTFTSKSRLQQSLVWHYNHVQTVEGRDRGETKGTCSPTEGLLPKMYVGIKAITSKWAPSCGWPLMLFIMSTYISVGVFDLIICTLRQIPIKEVLWQNTCSTVWSWRSSSFRKT